MANRNGSDRVARSANGIFTSLPSDLRSWIVTAVATAIAYLLVSRGSMLFYSGWQVPLFVGAVAGLAASTLSQGALTAGLVAAVALIATPPTSIGGARLGIDGWLLGVVLAVCAAAAIGAIRASLPSHRRTTALALSAGLVAWLLVNMWVPLLAAGFPPSAYGPLQAVTLRDVPQPHHYVNDDAIYRRVFYLMHRGEGYYQAFHDAWLGLQQSPALPNSVTAYRLPTLFWIWRLLPADAFSIAVLFLGFASVGVVASACIAGQLVGVRLAPLAATAMVAYAMGSAITVYVTYVDLPAMCVALVGVALYLRALLTGDRRVLWMAVGMLTFSALMREILIYLPALALLTSLLEPAEERLRKAGPWLASLGVFAMAYAAHAYSVRHLIAPNSGGLSYLQGSPAFVFDALRRFSDAMNGGGVLLIALFLLGLVGAIASRQRAGLPFAVFASAALVTPLVVMLRVGNPGIDAAGNHINYWGNLFIPLALALWPAWALLLPSDDVASEVKTWEP